MKEMMVNSLIVMAALVLSLALLVGVILLGYAANALLGPVGFALYCLVVVSFLGGVLLTTLEDV